MRQPISIIKIAAAGNNINLKCAEYSTRPIEKRAGMGEVKEYIKSKKSLIEQQPTMADKLQMLDRVITEAISQYGGGTSSAYEFFGGDSTAYAWNALLKDPEAVAMLNSYLEKDISPEDMEAIRAFASKNPAVANFLNNNASFQKKSEAMPVDMPALMNEIRNTLTKAIENKDKNAALAITQRLHSLPQDQAQEYMEAWGIPELLLKANEIPGYSDAIKAATKDTDPMSIVNTPMGWALGGALLGAVGGGALGGSSGALLGMLLLGGLGYAANKYDWFNTADPQTSSPEETVTGAEEDGEDVTTVDGTPEGIPLADISVKDWASESQKAVLDQLNTIEALNKRINFQFSGKNIGSLALWDSLSNSQKGLILTNLHQTEPNLAKDLEAREQLITTINPNGDAALYADPALVQKIYGYAQEGLPANPLALPTDIPWQTENKGISIIRPTLNITNDRRPWYLGGNANWWLNYKTLDGLPVSQIGLDYAPTGYASIDVVHKGDYRAGGLSDDYDSINTAFPIYDGLLGDLTINRGFGTIAGWNNVDQTGVEHIYMQIFTCEDMAAACRAAGYTENAKKWEDAATSFRNRLTEGTFDINSATGTSTFNSSQFDQLERYYRQQYNTKRLKELVARGAVNSRWTAEKKQQLLNDTSPDSFKISAPTIDNLNQAIGTIGRLNAASKGLTLTPEQTVLMSNANQAAPEYKTMRDQLMELDRIAKAVRKDPTSADALAQRKITAQHRLTEARNNLLKQKMFTPTPGSTEPILPLGENEWTFNRDTALEPLKSLITSGNTTPAEYQKVFQSIQSQLPEGTNVYGLSGSKRNWDQDKLTFNSPKFLQNLTLVYGNTPSDLPADEKISRAKTLDLNMLSDLGLDPNVVNNKVTEWSQPVNTGTVEPDALTPTDTAPTTAPATLAPADANLPTLSVENPAGEGNSAAPVNNPTNTDTTNSQTEQVGLNERSGRIVQASHISPAMRRWATLMYNQMRLDNNN